MLPYGFVGDIVLNYNSRIIYNLYAIILWIYNVFKENRHITILHSDYLWVIICCFSNVSNVSSNFKNILLLTSDKKLFGPSDSRKLLLIILLSFGTASLTYPLS